MAAAVVVAVLTPGHTFDFGLDWLTARAVLPRVTSGGVWAAMSEAQTLDSWSVVAGIPAWMGAGLGLVGVWAIRQWVSVDAMLL